MITRTYTGEQLSVISELYRKLTLEMLIEILERQGKHHDNACILARKLSKTKPEFRGWLEDKFKEYL